MKKPIFRRQILLCRQAAVAGKIEPLAALLHPDKSQSCAYEHTYTNPSRGYQMIHCSHKKGVLNATRSTTPTQSAPPHCEPPGRCASPGDELDRRRPCQATGTG